MHWANQSTTRRQTYSTKRAGASTGCCGFTPRRTSSITRSQMTGTIKAGVSHKTKQLITDGDRAVFASCILQTGNRRGCANIRVTQTESRILPDDTPPHPYTVAMESAMLAQRSEVSMYPWKDTKDKIPVAVRHVRTFLRAHRPAMG